MIRIPIDKQLNYITDYATSTSGVINVSGISGTGSTMLSALIAERKNQCIIVTSSYEKGKKLRDDIAFFVEKNQRKIILLPEENQLIIKYEAKSHAHMEQRLRASAALLQEEPCIIIGTPESLLKKVVPKDDFMENVIAFAIGEEIDLEDVKDKLMRMGYERSGLVESKGQYGIRGDIIDIFPPNEEHPVRIELFDTEVDSIRYFEETNQRSLENCDKVKIYPAQELIHVPHVFERAASKIEASYEKGDKKLDAQGKKRLRERKDRLIEYIQEGLNLQLLESYIKYFYDEPETLLDYASEQATLIVDDIDRILGRIDLYMEESSVDFDTIVQKGDALADDFDVEHLKDSFIHNMGKRLTFLLNTFAKTPQINVKLTANLGVSTKQMTAYYGKMDVLAEEIKSYVRRNYKVVISCTNDERSHNIKDFIDRSNIPASAVELVGGELSAGVEFVDERIAIISDKDIFVAVKRKSTSKENSNAKAIKTFTEIKHGDYIVHENHGIGKFIGIEQLTLQGVTKDYLKIKYAGEDFLYVPVGQMDFIQKYIGSDSGTPKVNKLSGNDWKKTKIKAKVAIAQMAKELMEITATRRMLKGHAFAEDSQWQHDFEDAFQYVETGDQLRCIKEIKQDMEKDEIMERLLCGDVGYGKTEVAMRAAFKCAMEGKQVAVLVPTTILANQHYHSFMKRFDKFPVHIEMLSRFRTDKQQDAIIDKIEAGKLDIIIGTHRVLSKDVKFKDLGMLIIDEEHRFGVQHKEVIKTLRSKIDVLTLSATPIPRTLHMSLSGIRNMSVIEEPPEERYPVQTYVMEQDDDMLKEIIRRELERDGQVYIVYNRVRGIEKVAQQIQTLVPEANIVVGHGQMNERELEDIMVDFMENKANILIATTIIESGIDIANANTMIILDADKLGLSQLYQLRGRVGRSYRMAYAYLFYQRNKVLTEIAEKRLRAIREFTEFGSGFKIAMRDLEIRGAGNLLGTEQSGHMMTIGYELYCKLLDDAVKALKGKGEVDDAEVDAIEAAIELKLDAYIDNEYISDEVLKLQMYKKISEIRSEDDEMEVRDELLDRFGDLPTSTDNLVSVASIKSKAQKLGVLRVYEEKNQVVCEFGEVNNLNPMAIPNIVKEYGPRVTIYGGKKPHIACHIAPKQDRLREIKSLLHKLLVEESSGM